MSHHIVFNLGDVACKGILLGLSTMFKIDPDEKPSVEMELVSETRIYASHESYASLIKLKHSGLDASGYIFLLLPKHQGKSLLNSIGLHHISDKDIEDFAGEFCNIIAGTFKTEIIRLGLGSIEISLPKIYTEGVDRVIDDTDVDTMYRISIPYKGQTLMTVEVAFQSKKERRALLS